MVAAVIGSLVVNILFQQTLIKKHDNCNSKLAQMKLEITVTYTMGSHLSLDVAEPHFSAELGTGGNRVRSGRQFSEIVARSKRNEFGGSGKTGHLIESTNPAVIAASSVGNSGSSAPALRVADRRRDQFTHHGYRCPRFDAR